MEPEEAQAARLAALTDDPMYRRAMAARPRPLVNMHRWIGGLVIAAAVAMLFALARGEGFFMGGKVDPGVMVLGSFALVICAIGVGLIVAGRPPPQDAIDALPARIVRIETGSVELEPKLGGRRVVVATDDVVRGLEMGVAGVALVEDGRLMGFHRLG